MPSYNGKKFICKAVESVINQTERNLELLIIDDCSTDETESFLLPYIQKDSRIIFYKLDTHSGSEIARTKAIQLARGKYIAFLDCDDIWMPEKLEKQILFMESRKIPFSCTAYYRIDEDDNICSNKIMIPLKKVNYDLCLTRSNPIGNSTVIYNQETLGKFEVPPIKKRNDFALWLKILKKTDYCYGLDQVLTAYRVHKKNSLSSHKLSLIKYHWYLYYRLEKLGFLKSVYLMLCWVFVKTTEIGLDIRKRK